jgi:hypothetical protein
MPLRAVARSGVGEPIVLMKLGNAGGGKGPHFGVLSMKPRRRRLA